MKDEFDDLDDEQLYASFEAYKTLLDAGLSKKNALERTGLTAQIVKDLEAEEDELDFRSEFKEVWTEEEDDDAMFASEEWQSDDDFNDASWNDDDEEKDYY
ncbi:hypothetical protein RCC89_04795 [Cytophagaceae bacterium ABcell3]|nr:hypothetical protein RCC89_04795 [Cytophagaceae bacterium ABcell3]